jgi:hypothetical protein
MAIVKLKKPHHRVVRIPRDIQDLFRIKELEQDLARDLSYNVAGAGKDLSYRTTLLTQLHADYYGRHGKVADTGRLKV